MLAETAKAPRKYPGSLKGPSFQFIPNPHSDQLIIFFSGTGKKNGKFDFWSVGRTVEANVLFVNDDRNHWYQDGIRGLGGTVNATVDLIDEWRRALGVKETYTVGASMGGYGATLYGCLLNAKVVAFGFDTLLRLPTSPSQTHMPPNVKLVFPDLRPLIAKTETPVQIYLGEMFTVDIIGALRVYELPSVTVETLRGVGHGCARYVHETVGLQTVFSALMNDQPFPKFANSGTICNHPKLVSRLYKAHVAAEKNEWGECAIRCRDALKIDKNSEPANYLLGRAYLKLRKPQLAVTHLAIVAATVPDFEDGSYHFAYALRCCKHFERAIFVFQRHLEKWPQSGRAHYHTGVLYGAMGRRSEAVLQFKLAANDARWRPMAGRKLLEMGERLPPQDLPPFKVASGVIVEREIPKMHLIKKLIDRISRGTMRALFQRK